MSAALAITAQPATTRAANDNSRMKNASGYKPSMFNRYAYVANNPVNGTDPDGMQQAGGWPMMPPPNVDPVEFQQQQMQGQVMVAKTVAAGAIAYGVVASGGTTLPAVAETLATNAAIGVATGSTMDVAIQTAQAGGDISQVDLGQTLAKAPKNAVGGMVGGALGKKVASGLSAMGAASGTAAAQLTDDVVLQGALKATEFVAAKAAGAAGGAAVKTQVPDIPRKTETP